MSQQDHKDFFISYNGADQRWAEWIAWQLEEASYAVILQAWDFLPGSNFVVQMDRALTLAPRMIAVLSPQYLSALYTQPEWAAAFRRDPKGEQSLLIPVRVQTCEVTGLLGPIVYVDLVGLDEATARQRLLAAVRHERAKPAQAPAFPQTIEHTISKQLNFPGDLPPIWKMPHQRDPLFLGREQLLQELHNTLATDHHVLLFELASEREAGTSGATETAVEYAYRYRSDYQVIAWIQADSREAFRSDLLSLAAELHLPQANPSDQDPLKVVVQWLRTHQHWLLVLDQVGEKEVLAPLMPLPQQGHLLVVTSTRSLESLAPLLELSQVPWEERTVLMQLSQVVGAALQGPHGRMPLGLEPITIGRASTNQVILSDPSVSSRHAIIELKDQAYWITDKGSTNGTLLNQQRLVPQVPSQLHPGATIRFGNITCTYEVLDRPSRSPVSSLSSEQGNTSAGAYPSSSPTIERQQQDRVGQRFGNYRLSRLLGQGGFAEVYLGEHIFLDTQTAIKVLYTQLVGQDVEQFRQEARTIAHLEHPHIVRLLDFGVEGTTPYLIMSYAPHGTMRQRYPKGTRLPLEQVTSYVKQIAEALQYAHDRKVIHRDIKPENMLFGSDDQVVLSDFGIALVTQSSRYQQPNDIAGTIAYMAPEQIDAHPRPASDQYSLGIVVYEWLCGERPFHGSFTEIAAKQQLVAPPSLREKVPSLSDEVEQVVMTALAKDPKQRFGSVLAFANAIEQASQVKQPEPELESVPVVPVSETTDTSQSQQSAGMATPIIPFPQQVIVGKVPADTSSRQTVSEVSTDIPDQPHGVTPLSGNEVSADVAAPLLSLSPSQVSVPVVRDEPKLIHQVVSRRTVVVGLVGLAVVGVAGGGLIWLARSQELHAPSPTPKATSSAVSVESINSTGAMFGFDLQHTRFNPDEHILSPSNVSDLVLDWTATTGYIFTSSPVVANGVVYVVSYVDPSSHDGKLYALPAATGKVLWQQSGTTEYTPAVANGVVYAVSPNGLAALDATTGHLRWVTPSTVIVGGSPAVAHGIVYVAGVDQVYAFDAVTGHTRWISDPVEGTQGSSPAVANGVVYVRSGAGLAAFDVTTGHTRWTSVGGSIDGNSSPTVANGLVYIGSRNGGLAAYDAATGHLRWVTPSTAGSTGSSPAVAHGIVYIAESQVYAFDATTGHTRWISNFAGAYNGDSPLVANGVVYVVSAGDNKVYALDATTGSTLWVSPPTGAQVSSTPAVANGVVYVVSDKVYAFHLPGT